MFGVGGDATITRPAVGAEEERPSRTVREYPRKDMKRTAGDHEHTAGAVRRVIDPQTACYVRSTASRSTSCSAATRGPTRPRCT